MTDTAEIYEFGRDEAIPERMPDPPKPPSKIPNFEGEPVVATKGKVTSAAGLEIGDEVYRMDETVRMVVECRVVDVAFKANARGDLERIHTLKAIDSVVIPWSMSLESLREELA